jgi:hypothetical protein
MRDQELKVPLVLICPPVETYVFLSTSAVTVATGQLPQVLRRHLVILVFFALLLLDLRPPV